MARTMKEAVAKASAEHKQFEQQLKTRRKDFSESLGGLQGRVDAFAGYDVSARRAEYAQEVRSMVSSLSPIEAPHRIAPGFSGCFILCLAMIDVHDERKHVDSCLNRSCRRCS